MYGGMVAAARTCSRTKHCNVAIETASELTRGHTAVDFWGVSGRTRNVHWAYDVNVDGFFSPADRSPCDVRPMTPKIAVVGSVNLDIVAHAPRLPVAGETVTDATLNRYPWWQRGESSACRTPSGR